MIERTKTFAIIVLLGFSVILCLDYFFNRKTLDGLVGTFEKDRTAQDISQFRYASGVLQALQSEGATEAAYLLYVTAQMNAVRLQTESISDSLAKDIENFESAFFEFMSEQCARSNPKACLQFGYLLASSGEYDLAFGAFRSSADAGNLSAMAALVDLYRNKSWPKNSEEKAREWLSRVGKQ